MKAKLILAVIGLSALTALALFTWWPTAFDENASSQQNHDHTAISTEQLYICPMHPQINSTDPDDTCPICGMDLVPTDPEQTQATSAAEQLYICPMHPQISSTNPDDTCPICGMDLVPAEQGDMKESTASSTHPHGHADVKVSEVRKQLLGLKLQTVAKETLFRTVTAPGRAAYDPELYTAQAEYQQALQQLQRVEHSSLPSVKKNVQRMIDSSRVRLKVLGLSDSEIRSIKPTSNISDTLLVYKKGDNVWIYADVFEMDLAGIEKGQSAKITANYLEGRVIPGIVTSTDQIVDPETRTAKVRIQVKNSPINIRAESYVDVSIYVPLGEHVAVPLDAVVDTGKETFVFVKKDDDTLEPRKVTTKFRAGDKVAIAEGLQPDDEIVTSGNFLVDSESRLKGVIQDMTPSHPH